MNCADCQEKDCYIQGKDCFGIRNRIISEYATEDKRMLKKATRIESSGYMRDTRLEELIKFSREMEYRHLGVAFCIGLENEAMDFKEILSAHDLKVSSVCCKICGISTSDIF